MNSDSDRATGVPRWGPWLAALLSITAYPLSLGPMGWLCVTGRVAHDNQFWTAFYSPLRWVIESSPTCGDWLDFYLDLWIS